eukprot:3453534-Prymnesium_polylepis.1
MPRVGSRWGRPRRRDSPRWGRGARNRRSAVKRTSSHFAPRAMEVSRVRAAALRAFLAALNLEKHAATLVALDLGNVDEYASFSDKQIDCSFRALTENELPDGHALKITHVVVMECCVNAGVPKTSTPLSPSLLAIQLLGKELAAVEMQWTARTSAEEALLLHEKVSGLRRQLHEAQQAAEKRNATLNAVKAELAAVKRAPHEAEAKMTAVEAALCSAQSTQDAALKAVSAAKFKVHELSEDQQNLREQLHAVRVSMEAEAA